MTTTGTADSTPASIIDDDQQHPPIHSGSTTYAAAPVTPREPIFTKGEKTGPNSRPTCMQNFTPLAFSAAKKSVTVQIKQTNK